MRVDIALAGHVCVDLAPCVDGEFVTTPGVLTQVGPMRISIGGAVGNGARAAHALGATAAVLATVGDDDLGRLCAGALERFAPGQVALHRTATAATSYSVVLQHRDDRSFWHHTGANDEFDGTGELPAAGIVHFGYPTLVPGMTAAGGQPTVALFRRARAAGATTSLDTSYCAANSALRSYPWDEYFAQVLPEVDVFCPSWDDLTSAYNEPDAFDQERVEQAAVRYLTFGAGLVLITAGGHGAYLASPGGGTWIPPEPVTRIVSTNGAGDTFKVAFLLAARTAPPVAAARRAATVAARYIAGLPLIPNEMEQ